MTAPTTVTAWLDEADVRSRAIDAAEDAAEEAEIAGRNYAVTIVPLSVSNALEASAADAPEMAAALRAVDALHQTDESGWCNECDRMAGPTGRCDTVAAIATALGVSEP